MDASELLQLYSNSQADDPVAELRGKIQEAVDTDGADLNEVEQTATEQLESAYNDGKYEPSQAGEIRNLAQVLSEVRSERDDRAQAAAELDAEMSNLMAQVRGDTGDESDDQDDEQDDDSGVIGGESAETDQSSAGDAPAQDTPAEQQPAATVPTQPASSPDPVPAAATGQRSNPRITPPRSNTRVAAPSFGDVRSHQPDTKLPDSNSNTIKPFITAAADVPDVPAGQNMNMRDVANATLSRFRSMPIGQPNTGEVRKSVAVVNKGYPEALTASGKPGNDADTELVERVADEKQLPGGSLVAAAQLAEKNNGNVTAAMDPLPTPPGDVWCAPSQRDFELCPPLAQRSNMLDLPSMAMPSMGGIQWPTWWQFPDQHQPPESNQPDGNPPGRNSWHGYNHMYDPDLKDPDFFKKNPKKCIQGPCPDWQEERLNLAYLCITGSILREYVWPSIAERFISDSLLSHARYMNGIYISTIMARSDNLPAFSANDTAGTNGVNGYGIGSAAEAVLERVGFLATWFRTTYRMAPDETLEGFAPLWFREYLKIDLERKLNRPHGSVSNAEVTALFAQWNTRIQWVMDHPEDLDNGNQWNGSYSGGVMPGSGADANWPDNVTLTFYPAGSWVLAEDNIIRLDSLYSSEQLANNEYTALFTEDAWLLMNRCNRSF
ncbi:hypothetical protein FHX42_005333, partial [Saccharopolyspora lacisalsi]